MTSLAFFFLGVWVAQSCLFAFLRSVYLIIRAVHPIPDYFRLSLPRLHDGCPVALCQQPQVASHTCSLSVCLFKFSNFSVFLHHPHAMARWRHAQVASGCLHSCLLNISRVSCDPWSLCVGSVGSCILFLVLSLRFCDFVPFWGVGVDEGRPALVGCDVPSGSWDCLMSFFGRSFFEFWMRRCMVRSGSWCLWVFGGAWCLVLLWFWGRVGACWSGFGWF
jgi:hypothetical protein